MTEPISIVLTLREDARSLSAIEKVKEAAQAIGLTPSSEGAATICCRISTRTFKKLFEKSAVKVEQRPASDADHGAPAGYVAESLPIADSLKEWVEHVSVLPPAIRMHDAL